MTFMGVHLKSLKNKLSKYNQLVNELNSTRSHHFET